MTLKLEFHTERLTLSPLADSDLDVALEMFTDPNVVKYVCDLMTEEEIHQEMANWTKRGGNGCIGIWCISNRESGEKLGSALLLPMPVEEDDTDYSLVVMGEMPDADIEIGFCLKQSAWGRGYATETCQCLLRFAFEQTELAEIVASFYEENTASRAVLEKCGLIDRGRMKSYGVDSPNYRITRQEWRQIQDDVIAQG